MARTVSGCSLSHVAHRALFRSCHAQAVKVEEWPPNHTWKPSTYQILVVQVLFPEVSSHSMQ